MRKDRLFFLGLILIISVLVLFSLGEAYTLEPQDEDKEELINPTSESLAIENNEVKEDAVEKPLDVSIKTGGNISEDANPELNKERIINVAKESLINKDYSKALTAAKKMIELSPNDPSSYAGLGMIQHYLLKHDDAIIAFKKAILLDPNNGDFYLLLGIVYQAMGDKQEAKLNFQKAYELSSSSKNFQMSTSMIADSLLKQQ